MSRLIDAYAITNSKELTKKIFSLNLTPYIKVDDLLDFIDKLPTIEAVPVVHAEWTNTGNTELDNVYSAHKCSVCGYTICGNASRFCGGCGAYMRKGGAT